MPEYNIIKIIDGLFVSDQPVTLVLYHKFRMLSFWPATKLSKYLDGQLSLPNINSNQMRLNIINYRKM